MKASSSTTLILFLASAVATADAFTMSRSSRTTVISHVPTSSTTALSMGLFDFFSEEARQKREAKKQAEIEEQERLQKAILERRKNPELMEEYESKIRVRRKLRMQGKDAEAEKLDLYEGAENQTLLDGTEGSTKK